MITHQNLLAHELIGLSITVMKSSDPRVIGVTGAVKNETRNTLIIEKEGRGVRISKEHSMFAFILPNGQKVTVDGTLLMHRPEDRVKRGLTRW